MWDIGGVEEGVVEGGEALPSSTSQTAYFAGEELVAFAKVLLSVPCTAPGLMRRIPNQDQFVSRQLENVSPTVLRIRFALRHLTRVHDVFAPL